MGHCLEKMAAYLHCAQRLSLLTLTKTLSLLNLKSVQSKAKSNAKRAFRLQTQSERPQGNEAQTVSFADMHNHSMDLCLVIGRQQSRQVCKAAD